MGSARRPWARGHHPSRHRTAPTRAPRAAGLPHRAVEPCRPFPSKRTLPSNYRRPRPLTTRAGQAVEDADRALSRFGSTGKNHGVDPSRRDRREQRRWRRDALRRLEELDRVDREQGLGAMPLGTPEDPHRPPPPARPAPQHRTGAARPPDQRHHRRAGHAAGPRHDRLPVPPADGPGDRQGRRLLRVRGHHQRRRPGRVGPLQPDPLRREPAGRARGLEGDHPRRRGRSHRGQRLPRSSTTARRSSGPSRAGRPMPASRRRC